MVFFRIGWVKRRSTRTTTVLSFLSLTTVPWRTRFGMASGLLLGRALRRGIRVPALLVGDRRQARNLATDDPHARSILQLAGGALKAEVELLLLQLRQLVGDLVGTHQAGVGGLHLLPLSPRCAR